MGVVAEGCHFVQNANPQPKGIHFTPAGIPMGVTKVKFRSIVEANNLRDTVFERNGGHLGNRIVGPEEFKSYVQLPESIATSVSFKQRDEGVQVGQARIVVDLVFCWVSLPTPHFLHCSS